MELIMVAMAEQDSAGCGDQGWTYMYGFGNFIMRTTRIHGCHFFF